MSNVKEYNDIMAFHPGYYVAEIIEDLNISQSEFAERLNTTGKTVSKLVNGQIDISNDLAKKLSLMLGTSVELWLNLQKNYDQKAMEIEIEEDLDRQEEIVKCIDYNYFEELGVVETTRNSRERVANLCKYFMVTNLQVMKKTDFLVNFRSSSGVDEEKKLINSRAWLQTAINMSKDVQTRPFNEKKLIASLPELRGMTVQSPDTFYPRMKEIFQDCGVIFVLLPHLKNSGVNGAVKWLSADRVILAMNNRGLDADKFWFTLFHEIKHVLQKKIKTVFVSLEQGELASVDASLELEADKFAKEYLIPCDKLDKLVANQRLSNKDICEFASSIGIHPGIVVGRLQYEGLIPYSRANSLKEKYIIK